MTSYFHRPSLSPSRVDFNDLAACGLVIDRFLHCGWEIFQVHPLARMKAFHLFAEETDILMHITIPE